MTSLNRWTVRQLYRKLIKRSSARWWRRWPRQRREGPQEERGQGDEGAIWLRERGCAADGGVPDAPGDDGRSVQGPDRQRDGRGR